MRSCSAAAGSTTRSTTASSLTRSPRPAKLQGRDLRRRNVARRHSTISIEVQLEDRRLPDLLVIHLALGLGSALQQDPGGLQWVCMADQKRHLAWVLAGDSVGDIQHPPAQGLDRFVTGLASAAELVREETRPSNRNLPAGHPLQIAAELGFAQGGLRD